MEGLSITDVMERTKAVNGTSVDSSAPKAKNMSLEKAINSLPRVQDREVAEALFQKELRSPDLAALRLVSLAGQSATLANEQTVTLNVLESNPVVTATDLQIRWNERMIGTDVAAFFNPNGDFPGEVNSLRPMRDNTIGFMGNKILVRIIAEALAAQSPISQVNQMQQEVEFELIRIRRFCNAALLSNSEVKAENVGNTPQWGGLINRSSFYNLATSGDLTNGLIQGRVDAIANAADPQGLGYNVPLIALCRGGQLGKIEDLMIARWPGSTSETMKATMSDLMSRVQLAGIAPEQCVAYKPRPGRPILFIYEPQMPSGTCLFLDPSKPQLAKFQMMGTFGPWILERPTEALTKIVYCFDSLSLIDQQRESRAILTGLNN